MQPFQEIQNMDPAGFDQGYGYLIGTTPDDASTIPGGGMSVYYPNGGGGSLFPDGQGGVSVVGVGPGQIQNPLAGPVVMPMATAATRPSVADTVAVGTVWDWFNGPATPMPPRLTPMGLLRPMPSIVQSQPVDVSVPVCDPVSQWVGDNPMLAILALAGVAVWLWK